MKSAKTLHEAKETLETIRTRKMLKEAKSILKDVRSSNTSKILVEAAEARVRDLERRLENHIENASKQPKKHKTITPEGILEQ